MELCYSNINTFQKDIPAMANACVWTVFSGLALETNTSSKISLQFDHKVIQMTPDFLTPQFTLNSNICVQKS